MVPNASSLRLPRFRCQEPLHLKAIGNGKSYLGKRVLEWARLFPDHPRVPEALFIAFKANENYKYGCGGWECNEEIQQEADSLLRRRYPATPWTAKLPQ